MPDEQWILTTTEYFVTVAEYLPTGVEDSPSPAPEDNPWYVLHARADAVRVAWSQAYERLKSAGAPIELLAHVESGLVDCY